MMFDDANCILFDDDSWKFLFPLTLTRPVGEVRVGIMTIREKWEKWTGKAFSFLTQDYLQQNYPFLAGRKNMLVNGSIPPDSELVKEIAGLVDGEVLVDNELIIAACVQEKYVHYDIHNIKNKLSAKQVKSDYRRISRPWQIFQYNGQEIISDYSQITRNRESFPVSRSNQIIDPGNIFLEEGAILEHTTLNASSGPIYIGRNAEIMEGALIRGPFSLGEGSQVKMGAKIYGPTTIGPFSKAGGEITNSILFAYSNKVHDGYLGNSVIGQWCNLGADTNASNLKNNYAPVKVWDYTVGKFQDTGLQFCGLIMGDYSRCGINTMFNTGTVVGICANIYGSGFPRNFIPSFSKGGSGGFRLSRLEEIFESLERAMPRRNRNLKEKDRNIIRFVYENIDRYGAG